METLKNQNRIEHANQGYVPNQHRDSMTKLWPPRKLEMSSAQPQAQNILADATLKNGRGCTLTHSQTIRQPQKKDGDYKAESNVVTNTG